MTNSELEALFMWEARLFGRDLQYVQQEIQQELERRRENEFVYGQGDY